MNESTSEQTGPEAGGAGLEPVIRDRAEHSISRKLIDPFALKVLYRLHNAGFTAYLVGGGVRDLLLQCQPKDFDVSTDAKPQQVKRLFRNCFLIGRRFRLAHIRYGDTVIETSTFRKAPQPDEEAEDILIRSDNVFGTPEEDALRRDFTINGLFYDIATFQVIDYVGGLSDLEGRLIRAIGDPDIRFREDPVRMLRAIRFASRLSFSIEPKTLEAICTNHAEIAKAAPARLYEEVLKFFKFGAARHSFQMMYECGLLAFIFPSLAKWLDEAGADGREYAWRLMDRLDELNRAGDPGEPEFLFGTLFYPLVGATVSTETSFGATLKQIRNVAMLATESLNIPKWRGFIHNMSLLFLLQWQLRNERKTRRLRRILAEPLFRDALTLYRFHEEVWGTAPDSRRAAWECAAALRAQGRDAETALLEAQLLDPSRVSSRRSRRFEKRERPAEPKPEHASDEWDPFAPASPAPLHGDWDSSDQDDDAADVGTESDETPGDQALISWEEDADEMDTPPEGMTPAPAAPDGVPGTEQRSSSRRRRRRRRSRRKRHPQENGAPATPGAPASSGNLQPSAPQPQSAPSSAPVHPQVAAEPAGVAPSDVPHRNAPQGAEAAAVPAPQAGQSPRRGRRNRRDRHNRHERQNAGVSQNGAETRTPEATHHDQPRREPQRPVPGNADTDTSDTSTQDDDTDISRDRVYQSRRAPSTESHESGRHAEVPRNAGHAGHAGTPQRGAGAPSPVEKPAAPQAKPAVPGDEQSDEFELPHWLDEI